MPDRLTYIMNCGAKLSDITHTRPHLMKTSELAELTAAEMENISGGRFAPSRPRPGLILLVLLLLLLRGRSNPPVLES